MIDGCVTSRIKVLSPENYLRSLLSFVLSILRPHSSDVFFGSVYRTSTSPQRNCLKEPGKARDAISMQRE